MTATETEIRDIVLRAIDNLANVDGQERQLRIRELFLVPWDQLDTQQLRSVMRAILEKLPIDLAQGIGQFAREQVELDEGGSAAHDLEIEKREREEEIEAYEAARLEKKGRIN